MGRLASKRRVVNPVALHDASRLDDAVQSIKASFMRLDSSGAKLERAVARQRTRMLMHILGARSTQEPESIKMVGPASKFIRSNREVPPASHVRRKTVEAAVWSPCEGSDTDCSSCSDEVQGAAYGSCNSDEEETAFRQRYVDVPEDSLSEPGSLVDGTCLLTQDDLCSRQNSKPSSSAFNKAFVGSLRQPRDEAAGAAPVTAAPAGSAFSASAAKESAACFGGDGSQLQQQTVPGMRLSSASSTPRPCVSVAANRPFSAPRIRKPPVPDVDTFICEPATSSSARSRPWSAPGTARGNPARPSSATPNAPAIPSSARPSSASPRVQAMRSSARPSSATPSGHIVAASSARPPSAPSARPSSARQDCAPSGTTTQHRPAMPWSANPVQSSGGVRPGFGALHRRQLLRPQSAPRERPPTVPVCGPQTRFMGEEGSTPFVDTAVAPQRSMVPRPSSAPSGTRTQRHSIGGSSQARVS